MKFGLMTILTAPIITLITFVFTYSILFKHTVFIDVTPPHKIVFAVLITIVVYNIYTALKIKHLIEHLIRSINDVLSNPQQSFIELESCYLTEIAQLINSINQLNVRIEDYKQDSDKEKNSLRLNTHSIIESAFDAIVGINEKRQIVTWNPAAEEMFGYRKSEALGKTLEALIVPTHLQVMHQERVNEFYDRSSTKKRKVPFVMRRDNLQAQRRDGTCLPVEIVVIQTAREMSLVAFIRDISDKLELQKQTEHYMATLEQKVLERTRELEVTQQKLEHVNTLLKASQQVAINTMNIVAHKDSDG
jgi:PAS domain S-box-containing protein